jgi:DNA-binding winged helix-turn-helix (wHTH) protein
LSELSEAALLLWVEADEIKGRWTLEAPVTTIGRWHDNDVVVDDRWVSRHHARVVKQDDHYVVEDLDSKNGTFVNGQRTAAPTPLSDGDVVQVTPRIKLTFVDHAATAPLPGQVRPQGLALDMATRDVYVGGQRLDPPLSHAQFTLLELLARERGHVYSRDEIVSVVWPEDESAGVSDEAIDALVRRVRLRLREIDPDTEYLVTVRGYGFRLEPEGE